MILGSSFAQFACARTSYLRQKGGNHRKQIVRMQSCVAPATVHLVRHAQSNWNVLTEGQHVGQHPHITDVDSRLSAKGVQQAANQRFEQMLPTPDVILCSPLSRAIMTAVALAGNRNIEIRAEPLLSEWCENSCDCGRPGQALHEEFGNVVSGLLDLPDMWWPLSLSEIQNGGREAETAVDQRCHLFVNKLYHMPYSSVAIVGHCMLLQKLEQAFVGHAVTYMDNTELRTLKIG